MSKKKVLIISMTAGFGHARAGQALFDFAKNNLPDIQAEHLDIAVASKSFARYSKMYDVFSKKFPMIWKMIYSMPAWFFQIVGVWMGLFSGEINKIVAAKNPDMIIFTNVIVLPIFASYLKKNHGKVKIGVVVTDYHGHPFYKFSVVDHYFVPSALVAEEFEAMGVNKHKITVTGIPIDPRFFAAANVQDLKSKYGIKNNFPVVVFIASFKISMPDLVLITEQLLNLQPKINLVFIANGNEEIYSKVREKFGEVENMLLVKWTNVIDEYMKMSDVIISKAGGLTVSECLALHKPLIMVNPIPGQEEYNAKYVQDHNWGIKVNNFDQIAQEVPLMIIASKHRQMDFALAQNPCEKIFQTILK